MTVVLIQDAVGHIINSLQNTNADIWYDDEKGETWVVRGRAGTNRITITITDEDENDTTFKFALIPVKE